jgi:hypothetical protein
MNKNFSNNGSAAHSGEIRAARDRTSVVDCLIDNVGESASTA